MSHQFLKKFMIPNIDCYTRVIGPVHHLRTYQVKMADPFHDDPLLCCVFPFSLRGVALDWFYSLQLRSLRNFEPVSNTFFNQYASRQELKQNDNYLTIKMM